MRKGKAKGFTLAEVLITLGIIGVVAAMTLPALINATRAKELETGLTKAYSTLQNALQQMSYDEGQTVNPANYNGKFMKSFKKYFKTSSAAGYDGSHRNESGEADYVSHVYKTYNNNSLQMSWFDDGNAFLIDGMFILIEDMTLSGTISPIFITVDVNGYQNKPNRWGHDLFTFQLMDDGKLLPMGAEGTNSANRENIYCSVTSSNMRNGFGCTYKALTEKDYFKNLPK